MKNRFVLLLCIGLTCFSCQSKSRKNTDSKEVESVFKKFINTSDSVELFTYYLLVDSVEKAKKLFPFYFDHDFSRITVEYEDGTKILMGFPKEFLQYYTSSKKITLLAVLLKTQYYGNETLYDHTLQQAINGKSKSNLALYLLASLRVQYGYYSDVQYIMNQIPDGLLEKKELSLLAELREQHKNDKNYGKELNLEVYYPNSLSKRRPELPDSIANSPFKVD